MRIALLTAVMIALPAVGSDRVQAQTATIYPWCTSGASQEFGGRNCGFVSFEQCMDSARGNGQFCDENPFYQAPRPQPAKTRRKQHTAPSH